MGPEAGRAAERKLLRSVFVKGMAAAATEGMAAARAAGCEEWFHGEMVRVFETADAVLLERLLEGSRIHATRRVHEMEAAAEMLRELGMEPRVTTAAVDWLRELEAENRGRMPADDGYVALREAIVGGSLQPNERLVEARLSSTFGMGRTGRAHRAGPARAGRAWWSASATAARGCASSASDEAVEILEARAVLEGLAARHAASNADAGGRRAAARRSSRRCAGCWTRGDPLGASDQNAVLHRTLIEIANHPTVMRLIAMLESQLVRFQYRTILLPGRTERSFAEHAAIVDAVAAGDPDAAEAAMRRHLSHVADALRIRRRRPVGRTRDATPEAAPSQRARELVRGAYDTHVHIAPDVVERKIDDISLARRFAELGLAGVVLKSHYTSTAERASVVRAVVPEVETLGAISLNRAVGGMNPLAVEIAAREGARTVWLPTVDSENEAHEREAAPGAKVPVWVKVQLELRERGHRDRARAGRGRRREAAARDPHRARADRAARAGAGHRPPRAATRSSRWWTRRSSRA